MVELKEVLDIRTIDKVYTYVKEAKKKYGRLENPTYSNLIFYLERLEVMNIIVRDIPKSINFSGEDLVNYMKHLYYCIECTNGWQRYLQTKR